MSNIEDLKKIIDEKRSKIDIYEINPKLEKVLVKIIKNTFAEQYRDEVLEILKKSNKDTVKDFLFFGLSDKGNLTCLTIDFAKDKNGEKISSENFGNTEY